MRTHNFCHNAPRVTYINDSININTTTINNGTGFGSCFGYGYGTNCCGYPQSGWANFRNGIYNGLGTVGGFLLGALALRAFLPASRGRGGNTTDETQTKTTNNTPVTTVTRSAEDPDCKKIADIIHKKKALPKDATNEQIDAIIKDIDDALATQDNNNKTEQTRSLNGLKEELEKMKTDNNKPVDNNPEPKPNDGLDELHLSAAEIDILRKLKVTVKTLDPEKLYEKTPKGLSLPGNVADLTAENLKKIIKIANDHNLPVAVAHNPQAGKDRWVAGTIDPNKIKEENGKLSYEVNCNVNSIQCGLFGFNYSVTQKGSEFEVTCTNAGDGFKVTPRTFTYQNGELFRNEKGEIVKKK